MFLAMNIHLISPLFVINHFYYLLESSCTVYGTLVY